MATKNLTAWSQHGAPVDCVVDVPATSRAVHRKEWIANSQVPTVVQAATRIFDFVQTWPGGAVIRDAWACFSTAPAVSGGTATIQVDRISKADGTTTTVVVTAVTVLSGFTAGIPVNLTLAATNPTSIVQGDTVRVTIITSNNSVGTADIGFACHIVYSPVEPDPIIGTA